MINRGENFLFLLKYYCIIIILENAFLYIQFVIFFNIIYSKNKIVFLFTSKIKVITFENKIHGKNCNNDKSIRRIRKK